MTIWCALGAEEILAGRNLPKKVVAPSAGTVDLNHQVILKLLSSGTGFVFCGDLFILPKEQFEMNSFSYELKPEPLSIFIGHRGHTKRYDEILTPGIYRWHNHPSANMFAEYRRWATYAGNVVKQTFWEQQTVALDNVRALGLLQHHGTIGPTEILDLSYDVNIAKWFALNEWNQANQRYVPKTFNRHLDEDDMLNEASYIYSVVVRGLGGTRDPVPLKIREKEIRLMPWNLNPLWSTRPEAQRGFGVWGLGINDFDKFGAILSVLEARYHPYGAESGWDHIGGPTLRVDGHTYGALDDSSCLQDLLFPSEEPWLANALSIAKEGIAKLQKSAV